VSGKEFRSLLKLKIKKQGECITIMFTVEIDIEKCAGCGDCVDFCPSQSLELVTDNGKEHAVFVGEEGDCIGCMSCQEVCPENAITVLEV